MKQNYDQKRANALKALHAARIVAEAKAKKDAEIAAKKAIAEQNIISDAKID